MIRPVCLLGLFIGLACSSCEKAIQFTPDSAEPLLVVEATIENDGPPVVILSHSVDYFSKITPDLLSGSFAHNAVIRISNGSQTQQLKEYSVSAGNYQVYYYTVDSTQPSDIFLGQLKTSYTMTIQVDGREYAAQTHIPDTAKRIDSLWWKQAPATDDSSKVVLMAKIYDPPGLGNYIRYFTKTNDEPFYPGLNSVFDDQIVDGKTFNLQVDRGVDRNDDIDFENYAFFYKGDTVTVKFCNIDKATYDFWRTMEYGYGSIGNPFSSPTRVTGNIPGALGYFGGYAVQYRGLEIPE